MALESVHLAIATWWKTAWQAALTARTLGTARIVWPGDKPPAGTAASPWIRFQFQPITAALSDLGDTDQLIDVEQVAIEIHVKDGDGWRLLDQLEGDARRLFTVAAATPSLVGGARFGDRAGHAPRVTSRAPDATTGTWLRSVVVAPFYFEHTA